MRYRINDKKQKPNLSLKKILLQVAILGIVFYLFWFLWHYTKGNNFPVKRVKIFATYEHLTEENIRKIISPYLPQGFFHLSVAGIKKELLKQPWVSAVVIKRKWPDLITINIVEQHAILKWGLNSLVNSAGKFFTPAAETIPQNLPLIFGPENKMTEIFSLYQKMAQLLEPLDLSIQRLLLNPQNYWELVLSNETLIYLKESDPLGQFELLTSLYRKITADHEEVPKSIDLRYSSGFAVKWK